MTLMCAVETKSENRRACVERVEPDTMGTIAEYVECVWMTYYLLLVQSFKGLNRTTTPLTPGQARTKQVQRVRPKEPGL
jgi:hypothetical protein